MGGLRHGEGPRKERNWSLSVTYGTWFRVVVSPLGQGGERPGSTGVDILPVLRTVRLGVL